MKVFISFLKSPVGTTYYLEGLRIAIGTMGGDEDHDLTIAFIGKGARSALKGVDKSYGKGLIDTLQKNASGKKFYVERESLANEKITESELDENFEIASREDLSRKMLDADVTMSF